MPTYLFEIRPQLLTAHRAHFRTKHREIFPGNELSVMTNVAGNAMLVKVNSDKPLAEIIPNGLAPAAQYTLEEARALLQTPAWRPVINLPG